MVDREIVFCQSVPEWQAWLVEHQATNEGIRLAIAKKGGTVPGVSYAEALEEALCFGWIDGQKWRHDDNHFLQGFSPRRARSIWSQINRDAALRLIEAGRMQPAGLAEVERAQADGRWQAAYAGQKSIEVPDDLAAALAASPGAAAFFDGLSGVNRYAVLFRIANVKRADTRSRRIAQFVGMLERGETVYPQKPAG